MRAICSIMVLGCFGELHGKYHEKIRWCLSFVSVNFQSCWTQTKLRVCSRDFLILALMVFLVRETAGQGAAQDGTGTAWWSEIGGGEGAGESSGRRCPCPLSPHCEKFEMKYQSLTESKRCEYRFLCSAQAHCVVCLEFYTAIPGFNFQCKSMGKAARGWATTATGRRRMQAAQIPAEIWNMAGCTLSMR